MAITIHQNPQRFTPATNPIVWVFSSSETGQPNFSFKVELKINGALFGTYELYPMQGNFCKFDACEYVRSFISSHLKFQGGFIWESQDQSAIVQIIVYESYGTPPVIEPESSESSLVNIAFNGALRYQNFYDYNYQKYWLFWSNGMEPKFLTTYPRDQKQMTSFDYPFLVGIFSEKGDQHVELKLEIFDITGASIYTFIDTIILDYNVNMINISPLAMVSTGWASGIDFDDCYYYEVTLYAIKDSSPFTSRDSEVFRLYLDRSCSRFEDMRIYWMNKFGVIDQFTFNKLSIESSSIKAYDYQVQQGRWGEGFYDLGLNAPEKKIAMKSAEDRITINSDWMKPSVQNWLVRELYESPQIWMLKDGEMQPVIVENNQSTLKSRFKDGLIQETVNIIVTWSFKSQLN